MKGQRSTFQTMSLNTKKYYAIILFRIYMPYLRTVLMYSKPSVAGLRLTPLFTLTPFFFLEIIQDCKVMK